MSSMKGIAVWTAILGGCILMLFLVVVGGIKIYNDLFTSKPLSDVRITRDSTDQKKIDSLELQNANSKLQTDSLEELSSQKDRRLREQQIVFQYTLEQLKNKPAKVLYKETARYIDMPDSTEKPYCYDSSGQLDISTTYAERDHLKHENQILKEKDTVCSMKLSIKDRIISNQGEQMSLMGSQIFKLEHRPAVVIKRKWYVDAGIIIGSIALGYTIKSISK